MWSVKNLQKSELISKGDDIVKKMKSLSLNENHAVTGVSLEFESETSPPYSQGEFILQNFSQYRGKNEMIVYSLPLVLNGVPWRLKVYPFGNGNARNVYLSVFLEMG